MFLRVYIGVTLVMKTSTSVPTVSAACLLLVAPHESLQQSLIGCWEQPSLKTNCYVGALKKHHLNSFVIFALLQYSLHHNRF